VILRQTNVTNKQIGEFGSHHFLPYPGFIVTERRRPLPKEMLAYARSDTHFLLFIYDNLRNALIDRASSRSRPRTPEIPQSQANAGTPNTDSECSLLREVLSRSGETSLRLHQTESYDEDDGSGPGGWDTIARKWNKVAFTKTADSSVSKSIYLLIHDWRDKVAREEDESTVYVRWLDYSFLSFMVWNTDTSCHSTTYSNSRNNHQTIFLPSLMSSELYRLSSRGVQTNCSTRYAQGHPEA
jgi:hypothetical protein